MQFPESMYFIGHEFLDALPSFKFRFEGGLWYEVMIGLEKIKFNTEETEKEIKLGNKTFTEILSLPYNNTVKKILNPNFRFGDTKIEEGE